MREFGMRRYHARECGDQPDVVLARLEIAHGENEGRVDAEIVMDEFLRAAARDDTKFAAHGVRNYTNFIG